MLSKYLSELRGGGWVIFFPAVKVRILSLYLTQGSHTGRQEHSADKSPDSNCRATGTAATKGEQNYLINYR